MNNNFQRNVHIAFCLFSISCILLMCYILVCALVGHGYVRSTKDWLTGDMVSVKLGAEYSMYPDPKLTPGKFETLKREDLTRLYNGKTYSQSHRSVNDAQRRAVLREYGIDPSKFHGEIDHLYPLCAGGSNDISNLWPETAYMAKDKLEAELCRRIKAGKVDPAEAFAKITKDWYAYYSELGLDNADSYDD